MCLRNIFVLLLFVVLSQLQGFAQEDKADRLLKNGNLSEAAALYEKAVQKDSLNYSAVAKLASVQYELKQYGHSLETIQWLEESELKEKVNADLYARVLFMNQKYEEAIRTISANNLTELNGLKEQAQQILEWNEGYQGGKVNPIVGLNTSYNDYAPFLWKEFLLFISDRPQQQMVDPSAISSAYNSIYKTPYLNHGQLKFERPKIFDKKLDNLFHDGPMYFSEKDTALFFTRSSKEAYAGKNHVDRLGIHISKFQNGAWNDPVPFVHNSGEYNIAHPAMNADETRLYFSSDMPGSKGGMDLWYCQRQGDSWSEPVNLGSFVNTEGHEVFPSTFKDKLYFSSDSHGGYGNFDIFQTSEKNSWSEIRNMQGPLNSPYDDLCMFYMDETSAYFSSNRPGGLGGDDIYLYHVVEEATVFKSFKGKMSGSGLPPGTLLKLINADGEVIQTTELQEDESFEFMGVEGNATYTIEAAETQIAEGAKMQLFNNHGDVVQEVTAGKGGSFKIELLIPEDYDNLSLMANDDESLLSLDIFGQLDGSDSTETEGITIFIEDPNGNLLGQTYTDSSGDFRFKSIMSTDRYVIKAKITDPNSVINVMNEEGAVIQQIQLSENENFVYVRLSENDKIITLANDVKIREDENFNLPAILYGFNEYELNDDSRDQVDKLIRIMQENPHIKVRLTGHTDSKGSAAYNKKLSQRRIDSVVEYMASKGINTQQVVGIGYGEEKLLNDCNDDVDCDEELHAKNRRTEFSILSGQSAP